MKTTAIILALFVSIASARAADDFKPHYWTTEHKIEVPALLIATGADAYFTDRNLESHGREYNPLARPFVGSRVSRCVYFPALSVLTVGGSWWLEKHHHERAANWLLRLQLGSETESAIFSGLPR
jgi:hypothetical protein